MKKIIAVRPEWSKVDLFCTYSIREGVLLTMNLADDFLAMRLGSSLDIAMQKEITREFDSRYNFVTAYVESKHPSWAKLNSRGNYFIYLNEFASWILQNERQNGWDIPVEFRALANSDSESSSIELNPKIDFSESLEKVNWKIKKIRRTTCYRNIILDILKSRFANSESVPTAREVIDILQKNKPYEIHEVMSNSIKYYSEDGNIKTADLDSIHKTIRNLVVYY